MTMNEKRMAMYPETDYFKFNNLNPKGNITADCSIRALAGVTDKTWDETYDAVCRLGKKLGLMPSDRKIYEKYFKSIGCHYVKVKQPKHANNKKVTCKELIDFYNERGLSNFKIFASVGSHHVVAIINTSDSMHQPKYKVHDVWNSSNEYVGSYYMLFDEPTILKCLDYHD